MITKKKIFFFLFFFSILFNLLFMDFLSVYSFFFWLNFFNLIGKFLFIAVFVCVCVCVCFFERTIFVFFSNVNIQDLEIQIVKSFFLFAHLHKKVTLSYFVKMFASHQTILFIIFFGKLKFAE